MTGGYRQPRALARFAALFTLLSLNACELSASPSTPFDGKRAYRDLQEIVALGPRVSGTEASAHTRAIIRRELEAAGVPVEEHAFQASTPLGVRDMVNVVGVVQGTLPGIIILGNHYDTKYFPDFEFVGANDGASTTAWMIEMARALGPSREGHTIWLCWFDGEEAFEEWGPLDSLYGSGAMVKRLREEGRLPEVKAMINVDMIGDCDLRVLKDTGAPQWMVDAVWRTAAELGYRKHFDLAGRRIEDDHLPFRRAGVQAMNLIDFRYGGDRAAHDRNWHTVRDRLDLVCADSLRIVGDVIYRALERIETALRESNRQSNDSEK